MKKTITLQDLENYPHRKQTKLQPNSKTCKKNMLGKSASQAQSKPPKSEHFHPHIPSKVSQISLHQKKSPQMIRSIKLSASLLSDPDKNPCKNKRSSEANILPSGVDYDKLLSFTDEKRQKCFWTTKANSLNRSHIKNSYITGGSKEQRERFQEEGFLTLKDGSDEECFPVDEGLTYLTERDLACEDEQYPSKCNYFKINPKSSIILIESTITSDEDNQNDFTFQLEQSQNQLGKIAYKANISKKKNVKNPQSQKKHSKKTNTEKIKKPSKKFIKCPNNELSRTETSKIPSKNGRILSYNDYINIVGRQKTSETKRYTPDQPLKVQKILSKKNKQTNLQLEKCVDQKTKKIPNDHSKKNQGVTRNGSNISYKNLYQPYLNMTKKKSRSLKKSGKQKKTQEKTTKKNQNSGSYSYCSSYLRHSLESGDRQTRKNKTSQIKSPQPTGKADKRKVTKERLNASSNIKEFKEFCSKKIYCDKYQMDQIFFKTEENSHKNSHSFKINKGQLEGIDDFLRKESAETPRDSSVGRRSFDKMGRTGKVSLRQLKDSYISQNKSKQLEDSPQYQSYLESSKLQKTDQKSSNKLKGVLKRTQNVMKLYRDKLASAQAQIRNLRKQLKQKNNYN